MKYIKRYKKRKRQVSFPFPVLLALIFFCFISYRYSEEQIVSLGFMTHTRINIYIYLSIGCILVWIYPSFKRRIQQLKSDKYYRESGMGRIDHMSGSEFERFLIVYFKDLGYQLLGHPGGTGDMGADLLLKDPTGVKVVVQAKRHSKNIGYSAIQQVHTARSLYNAQKAILITNSYLTKQAYTTSEKLNIDVWNRDKLMKNLYIYRKKNQN